LISPNINYIKNKKKARPGKNRSFVEISATIYKKFSFTEMCPLLDARSPVVSRFQRDTSGFRTLDWIRIKAELRELAPLVVRLGQF